MPPRASWTVCGTGSRDAAICRCGSGKRDFAAEGVGLKDNGKGSMGETIEMGERCPRVGESGYSVVRGETVGSE